MKRDLYFFIGTEAELMKMFIVIKKAKEQYFNCKIVSSGQNDISNSNFLKLCDSKIDIDLTKYAPKNKGILSYFIWFLRTRSYGIKFLKKKIKGCRSDKLPVMVVHGDTLSTLLGATIAKSVGIKHVHVEGGIRSFNWLNPFPEEIDRYFSSKYADIVFCQNEWATKLAKENIAGEAVNTVYNTNIETLQYARNVLIGEKTEKKYDGKYFVAAIHRQENLLNKQFMINIINSIIKISSNMHCIFILHQQTYDAIKKYDILNRIDKNKNITVLDKLDYLEFIDVIDKSEFLLADGAGNQQEMYYMGKPYLILRKDIEEKSEGIGLNAIGFNNDFKFVESFVHNYNKYQQPPVYPEILPSDIIVNKLVEKYS